LTIDLDNGPVTRRRRIREDNANRIVFEDRPCWALCERGRAGSNAVAQAAKVETGIRIVEVEGLIGRPARTHVARTGQIGLIKIVKLDRRSMRCASSSLRQRALDDYRASST